MLGIDTRAAKAAWTVFLLAAVLYLLYMVRATLLIVVLSIFFAYLVYPLVRIGERYKPRLIPRTAVVAMVFLFLIALAGVSGAVFGSRIVDEAVRLSQDLPKLLDVANVSERIPLPRFLEPQRHKMVAFVTEQVQAGAGQAVPFAKRLGGSVLHIASNLIYLILIPILSFMLIKEGPAMRQNFLMLLDRSQSKLWGRITGDLDLLLAGFVRALLLLSLATFISYSAALSLMGAPYALLLGGTAALLEFIPFVGPLAAIGVLLAVLGFGGFEHLLWVLFFILAYRGLQDYVLAPYLMSEGVEVAPLLVIIGLLAGDQIAGIAGIFLSVPVIAAIRIIFMRVREAYTAKTGAPIPSPVGSGANSGSR